jgi:hypothetical protein
MRPRPPEPKGKLDAMTGYSFTTPVWDGGTWVTPAVAEVAVARKVNGPEDRPRRQDAPAEWDRIDWRVHEGQVRSELPRVFRTGKLRLIHAASCPFRYSSKTSCGVRYPSVEWRRVLL